VASRRHFFQALPSDRPACAAALLACFRLPEERNAEIRGFFPDLFA
jgi:hypothetical protein